MLQIEIHELTFLSGFYSIVLNDYKKREGSEFTICSTSPTFALFWKNPDFKKIIIKDAKCFLKENSIENFVIGSHFLFLPIETDIDVEDRKKIRERFLVWINQY